MSAETFPKVPKNKVGGMVQTAIGDAARKIVVAPNADTTCAVTFEWPDGEPGSAQDPAGSFASQETFPAVSNSEVGGMVQTAVNDGCVGIVAENKLNGTFSVLVNWPVGVAGGLMPAARVFRAGTRSARGGAGRRPRRRR